MLAFDLECRIGRNGFDWEAGKEMSGIRFSVSLGVLFTDALLLTSGLCLTFLFFFRFKV